MPVVTTFLGPPLRGYSTIRCALLASASNILENLHSDALSMIESIIGSQIIKLVKNKKEDATMTQKFQTLSDYLLQQGRKQGMKQGKEQGMKQGREQGMKQGREQGMAQGEILGTIRTCREYEITEDKIFRKIISKFKLQENEARQFMEAARLPCQAALQ